MGLNFKNCIIPIVHSLAPSVMNVCVSVFISFIRDDKPSLNTNLLRERVCFMGYILYSTALKLISITEKEEKKLVHKMH